MCPFKTKKTVSMTFFTDRCTQNIFLTEESVYFIFMNCFFLPQALIDKTIPHPLQKFLTKIYFSIHNTHSSGNSTWLALFSHEKLDERFLAWRTLTCGHFD